MATRVCLAATHLLGLWLLPLAGNPALEAQLPAAGAVLHQTLRELCFRDQPGGLVLLLEAHRVAQVATLPPAGAGAVESLQHRQPQTEERAARLAISLQADKQFLALLREATVAPTST